MADVVVTKLRRVQVVADTIGDVAQWLRAVEDDPMSTKLVEPITLTVEVEG